MDFNPIEYTSIGIASFSIFLSIWLFNRKQKSDQYKILLDIQDRLDKNLIELREIYRNLNKSETQREFLVEKRSNSLQCLNILEFFALLINANEIKERKIISHFKNIVLEESEKAFQALPDVKKENFQELETLIKKYNDHEFD